MSMVGVNLYPYLIWSGNIKVDVGLAYINTVADKALMRRACNYAHSSTTNTLF